MVNAPKSDYSKFLIFQNYDSLSCTPVRGTLAIKLYSLEIYVLYAIKLVFKDAKHVSSG